MKKATSMKYLWAILRICMGWLFLWPFLDKLFGLGFATPAEGAWLAGGSPTTGFLTHGTQGPFAEIFQSLAGSALIDWIFMLGLLFIGLALILGIGVRIAGYSGALMLVLMYLAGFIPPEHNPFLDDHLVYPIIMIGLTLTASGDTWGLGKKWKKCPIVSKYPILK